VQRTRHRNEVLYQLKRKLRNTAFTSLCLLLGLLCCSWPGFAANQIFVKTYPLISGGNFQLENVNGSIRVEGWERDEVEVRAVKSSLSDARDLERVKIEVCSAPNQVAVHTRYPEGPGVEVAVEYIVHVPFRVLLGSIGTVNGSVVVRGVNGGGELRSVNGNVEVFDSSGRFSAKTTNGDLHLELRRLVDGGPMNIETVNGSVFLGLPSDAQADLRILNMNGDFSSELPVNAMSGTTSLPSFRAKLGSGGGQISVRTVNGGIRLVRERAGA
jgi:Putative adhesin